MSKVAWSRTAGDALLCSLLSDQKDTTRGSMSPSLGSLGSQLNAISYTSHSRPQRSAWTASLVLSHVHRRSAISGYPLLTVRLAQPESSRRVVNQLATVGSGLALRMFPAWRATNGVQQYVRPLDLINCNP